MRVLDPVAERAEFEPHSGNDPSTVAPGMDRFQNAARTRHVRLLDREPSYDQSNAVCVAIIVLGPSQDLSICPANLSPVPRLASRLDFVAGGYGRPPVRASLNCVDASTTGAGCVCATLEHSAQDCS